MIVYLQHHEIDQVKWDLCLEQSVNSMVYGFSWYLNQMAPGWDALVLDDYRAVMPLTKGKKWFIGYLYQPFFTQQLGVFSKSEINAELVEEFVKAIPRSFRWIDIQLNEQNFFISSRFKLIKRRNFLLNLNKPYEKIEKGYNTQAKRNLKKARKNETLTKTLSLKEVIAFYRLHKGVLTKGVKAKHYEMLEATMHEAYERGKLLCKGVYARNGELLAAAAFLSQKGRVIFLIGNASASGRETGAMHALIDQVIFQFSNHKMVLDFEGSEIPGIARFYKSFGAIKVNYYRLKKNRLPWLLKILKW